MTSIRRRLLLWLTAAVLLASIVSAIGVYRQARNELDDVFDYHLEQIALSLRDRTFEQIVTEPPAVEDRFDFVIQVWRPDGVRLYYSAPRAVLPNSGWLGYANVRTVEGLWRVFTVQNEGRIVQVAQPMSVRNELAAAAALRMLMPFLLLLPVLALLIWITVGQGLRPLSSMARAVRARTPSALDPLPERGMPDEIQPLVASLNDLLKRLDYTLTAQRRFVGDAAHELRSPLTALRLQAQLAERAAPDEARAAAFATLKSGLARTAHVVEQLLTLAREEPDVAGRALAPVDLAGLAREVIADNMVVADARSIDLGMAAAEPAVVSGDREALRAALRNLVDNALRYTPSGGKVDIAVTVRGNAPVLEVTDDGPGIPEAERYRVFDRFYRGRTGDSGGSGLGLAIVKNVADRHGASVELVEGPGGRGLCVRIVFPRSAA